MRTVHQVSAYLRTRIDGEWYNFATVNSMIAAYADATGFDAKDIQCVNSTIYYWPMCKGMGVTLGKCFSVHRKGSGTNNTFRSSRSHPQRTRILRAPTMGPHMPE